MFSIQFQFQSSTPDSDIFQQMLQAKLYYEDNKYILYFFTNSKHHQQDGNVERENTKYRTEVKQSKQNKTVSENNKWIVETETENK